MPSALSYLLQSTAVSAFTITTGFFVWSKHCQIEAIDPYSDPTFSSQWYKKLNPSQNPTFQDVCVRRIPLTKLDPNLARDAENGGSKLVERFAQGVWGGFGFAIQRRILSQWYQDTTPDQLWTKSQLRSSPYSVGTDVANHFSVIERPSSNSIIFRCGDSPTVNPDRPRQSDGLFELSAQAKFDQGFAEFKLKSIFFQGEPKTGKAPFEGEAFTTWAHQMYDKLLLEDAVGYCRVKIVDIDWDAVKGKKPNP